VGVSLKVVEKIELDPPYPANTKAGSFSFEIEVDRLAASDTWILIDQEVRPWALMTWVLAWQQVPCGSWPDNDDVIAARIGCDKRFFALHRDEIMRGWILHKDGRLYHKTVTEKVICFLEMRDKWKKKDERRRKQKQAVNSELSGESLESHQGLSGGSLPSSSSSSSSSSSVLQPANAGCRETSDEISPVSAVPFEKIKALWAEINPTLPQPVKLSPARKAQIRARWNDELPDIDAWRECFTLVSRSKFLTGQAQPTPGRKPFRCTLDWITKQENLLKLYEGRYG